MWDTTFNLLVLIIVVKVSAVVITRFINGYHIIDTENRLNLGLVSRKDLVEISDSYFINWCLKILEHMSFTRVDLISATLNSDIQACAYKGSEKIYFKFLKCDPITTSKDEDDFKKIEKQELQKLIGTMEHDRVYMAWVITNGDFASDALEYAKSLPSNYNITLIDGCNLTRFHRRYQRQYITS